MKLLVCGAEKIRGKPLHSLPPYGLKAAEPTLLYFSSFLNSTPILLISVAKAAIEETDSPSPLRLFIKC